MKTLEKQAPIWGRQEAGKEAQGSGRWGCRVAGGHLHAPWGSGAAHGKTISGREGGVRTMCAGGLPPPESLCGPLTSGSSWCFMVAQEVGRGGGLSEPGRGRGGVPASIDPGQVPGPASPLRPLPSPQACFLVPRGWDSPGGLDRGSSAGGSCGAGPNNGARLMVPTASSGESRSWGKGPGAQPSC